MKVAKQPGKSAYLSRVELLVPKSTHDMLKSIGEEAGKTVSQIVEVMVATCLAGIVGAARANDKKTEGAQVENSTANGAGDNLAVVTETNTGDAEAGTAGLFRGKVQL